MSNSSGMFGSSSGPEKQEGRGRSRGPGGGGPERQPLEVLFGKPPPQAIEAEMALLGAMILEPTVTGDVIMLVKSPDFFYVESHKRIFQALITLYDKHQSGDLIQLLDALRDDESVQQVGGTPYLEKLASETPGPAGAVHWARIVADKAKLRSLISTASDIVHSAYTLGQGNDENATEIIDKAEQQIFEIARKHELFDPQGMAELIQQEYDRLESQWGKGVSGVATYYQDLDKYLGGLQPGELTIIAARPSMGKCVSFDTELVLDDGSVTTIEDLHRRGSGVVRTLDDSLKLRPATPSAYVDDGVKPVFEVVTATGRRIETTLSHPFLTVRGWTRLEELRPGDRVAVPRTMPVFGAADMRECEVKLLAYLIGDGGLTGSNPRFTNSNPRIAADFAAAVDEFGGLRIARSDTRDGEAPSWRVSADRDVVCDERAMFASRLIGAMTTAGVTSRAVAERVSVSPAAVTYWTQGKNIPDAATFLRLCEVLRVEPVSLAPNGIDSARQNSMNPLTRWLTELGLMGCGAHHKCMPARVFTLQRRLLALFLNRLFSTDGWASVLASGQAQVGYSTVNVRLARQVQHLLLRFGVVARLKQRWVRYRDARRPAWQLDITDATAIRTLADEIGIFGKEEQLERAMIALESPASRAVRDALPMDVWDLIEASKGEMSWAELSRRAGVESLHVRTRAPSRGRLAAISRVLGDAKLAALAESDVLWDRIVSITPTGPKQVYDLTIPGTHNFIAADVCVHNTAVAMNLVEQIALGGGPHSANSGPRIPCGFFSLEMSKSAIVQRLLSSRSGVDLHSLRTLGEMTNRAMFEDVIRRLQDAGGELHDAPIYIDDMPALTVMGLRARARRMVQQYGVRAIFIDYLQLMTAPAFARESRQVEVAAISRGIKALARELNMPVVCLAQLNRGPESRGDNRPRMSDLRESGSIEQDADVVILLHREEYYHVNDPSWSQDPDNAEKLGVAELIIAKQRNGPTGVVELKWDASTTRFKDLHRSGGGYAEFAGNSGGGGHSGGSPARSKAYTPEPKPAAPSGYSSGGGYADAAGNGGAPGYGADTPKSTFSPGKKAGPISNHRDGGGPERAPFETDDDEAGGLPI